MNRRGRGFPEGTLAFSNAPEAFFEFSRGFFEFPRGLFEFPAGHSFWPLHARCMQNNTQSSMFISYKFICLSIQAVGRVAPTACKLQHMFATPAFQALGLRCDAPECVCICFA